MRLVLQLTAMSSTGKGGNTGKVASDCSAGYLEADWEKNSGFLLTTPREWPIKNQTLSDHADRTPV